MKKIIFTCVATALIYGCIAYLQAAAFNGPSQTPPSGSGIVSAGSNNVAIGTQTPSSSVTLLLVGSTTDSSAYGLEILNSSLNPLLSVRNDGIVAIGTSTISGGTFAGTVSAANISSGEFGSNTGGGNYSFPASVGIGVPSPGQPLEVVGGENTGIRIRNIAAGANGAALLFNDRNFTDRDMFAINAFMGTGGSSDVLKFQYSPSSTLVDGMVLTNTGNVGIGTTTPAANLTVQGSAGQTADLFTIASSTGSTLLTVLANGNVGVGVASPGAKMDVAGSVNVPNGGEITWGGGAFPQVQIYGDSSANFIRIASNLNTGLTVQNNNVAIGAGNLTVSGNVGIGTTQPSSTLDVAGSSTLKIGTGAAYPGCIEMYDSANTSQIDYLYPANAVLVVTTTKPSFCQ